MVRRLGNSLCSFETFVTAIVALIALPTSLVFAQLPTGTILGVVKDSSGAVIPGVSVTVTNIDTSLSRTGASAEDGSYRFPALPVGHYRLDVMKEGFSALSRTGITLEVGQERNVDSFEFLHARWRKYDGLFWNQQLVDHRHNDGDRRRQGLQGCHQHAQRRIRTLDGRPNNRRQQGGHQSVPRRFVRLFA